MRRNINRSQVNNRNKDLFPVRVQGLSVDVSKYRNFDSAMNKWLRKVQDDGKLDEIRERRFYEKPSVKKRKRKALAKLKEKYRRENDEAKFSK